MSYCHSVTSPSSKSNKNADMSTYFHAYSGSYRQPHCRPYCHQYGNVHCVAYSDTISGSIVHPYTFPFTR